MDDRLKRRALYGVMLSVFLAAMESTVVATAMPTVVASLGGGSAYLRPGVALSPDGREAIGHDGQNNNLIVGENSTGIGDDGTFMEY